MTIFVWDDIICDIGANICIWSMSNICAVSSRHIYVFKMGRWGNIDLKYIFLNSIFILFRVWVAIDLLQNLKQEPSLAALW